MPRSPDTPCADCGKLLWSGTGSLPRDQRRCLDCRRKTSIKMTACAVCGGPSPRQILTCSKRCAYILRTQVRKQQDRPCTDCGAPTTNQSGKFGVFCDLCTIERRRARQRRRDSCRRGAPRQKSRPTLRWLGDRDGWSCHLCGKKVDRTRRWPDPKSATVDHLIPLSHGGDDEPSNLALAHFDCNVQRGNRGEVQLLLFG